MVSLSGPVLTHCLYYFDEEITLMHVQYTTQVTKYTPGLVGRNVLD